MTASTAMDLAQLLHQTRYLLLDFDGPICAIFAGTPADAVARQLIAELRAAGDVVPERLDAVIDPFDVLSYAATLSHDAAERTEAHLRTAEVAAGSECCADAIRQRRDCEV